MSRKFGAIMSYVLVVLEALASMVVTPIIIQSLGSEYGIYTLIVSITSYILLLDLGVGNSIVRFFSKYQVTNDRVALSNVTAISVSFYIAVSVIVVIVGVVIYGLFPSAFAVGLSDAEIHTARIMLVFTVISITFQMIAVTFSKLIIAHQKFVLSKAIAIIIFLVKMVLYVIVLKNGGKGIDITVINMTVTALSFVFQLFYVLLVLKVKPKFAGIKKTLVMEIIGFSGWIFVEMVATQINTMADQIIIGALIPASSVILAVYAVGRQITSYYQSISANVNALLMPGVVKMVENNADVFTVNKEALRISRYLFAMMMLILSVFAICGKDFVVLWAGAGYKEAYLVALLIMIPLTITQPQSICTQFMWAKGIAKPQSLLKIVTSVVNFVISIFLIKWKPLLGATIGTVSAYFLCDIAAANWLFKKHLGFSIATYFSGLFKGILPCSIVTILCGFFISKLPFIPEGWLGFCCQAAVMCLIYISLLWLIGLNKSEKELIMSFMKAAKRKIGLK